MTRFVAAIAAMLSLAMLMPPPVRSETLLTFYHYQAGASYKAFRKILDEFEAANPGVKVKDVFSQSEQITADVQTALAARRPVDVATVIGKNIAYFIGNTPAVAMDEDPALATFLGNYLPSFLDIGRANGKVYAVPHSYGTPMLYYNKDLFRKAGLNADAPPQSWDQLIQAAVTLQQKTGIAGLAHLHAAMKDYGTMLFVMNAGSPYLNGDGSCALFDTPRGIAALQIWQDIAVKHKVMPVANDRQWTAAFMGGQLGMYITSSAGLEPTYQGTKGKFELGVGGYPRFADGEPRRLPNSGAALMLYAPAGERRAASLKLLAHLAEPIVSNRWSRESGYMPLARDPLADPAMAAYVAEFPLVRPVIAQMAETVPTAVWGEKGALEAQTIVSNLIDALWAGKGPAGDLVPPAVARMNEAMGCKR